MCIKRVCRELASASFRTSLYILPLKYWLCTLVKSSFEETWPPNCVHGLLAQAIVSIVILRSTAIIDAKIGLISRHQGTLGEKSNLQRTGASFEAGGSQLGWKEGLLLRRKIVGVASSVLMAKFLCIYRKMYKKSLIRVRKNIRNIESWVFVIIKLMQFHIWKWNLRRNSFRLIKY